MCSKAANTELAVAIKPSIGVRFSCTSLRIPLGTACRMNGERLNRTRSDVGERETQVLRLIAEDTVGRSPMLT